MDEDKLQKDAEQRLDFAVPKWSELRNILKEWGCNIVSRGYVDILIRIIGEKKIKKEMFGLSLRPLVNASIKHCKNLGKLKLTDYMVIDVIQQSFPSYLELEMFQVETLKIEIERNFKSLLDQKSYDALDLYPMTCLHIFSKIFNNDKKLIDFFLEKLTFPEIRTDYSILRTECERLEALEEKTSAIEEKVEELTKKIYIIENFIKIFFEIYEFLEEHGTKEQVKIYEEKLWFFRLLQEKTINEWFKDLKAN